MEKPEKNTRTIEVTEEDIDRFIKYNRKSCWEAEFQNGNYCIGEIELQQFLSKYRKPEAKND